MGARVSYGRNSTAFHGLLYLATSDTPSQTHPKSEGLDITDLSAPFLSLEPRSVMQETPCLALTLYLTLGG